MSHINSGASPPQALEAERASGEVVDVAIAALCLVFVLEALFFAPLNEAPAMTLRHGSAQARGAIPCRDIRCDYTPLGSSGFALVGGAVVPSLLLAQIVIFTVALLTRRVATNLGFNPVESRRVLVVTWALLIASEGRGIELEPWAVAFVVAGAATLTASWSQWSAFRAGIWVAAGFWAKQYALFGWLGLLIPTLWVGKVRAAWSLTAGVVFGLISPAFVLLLLGATPTDLGRMLNPAAYPALPLWGNLTNAPDLFGVLVLTLLTVTHDEFRQIARPQVLVPASLTVAGMLPFYFRGYRHYWQLVIPFLVLLLFRPPTARRAPRLHASHRGALVLIALSVGLDVGRCVRDVVTGAREKQLVAARQMATLAQSAIRPLYLVAPAILAWIDAPILAMKEVGPKYSSFSRPEAEAVVADADMVVWDPSVAGTDELLRHLSRSPESALRDRGFTLLRAVGPVRVYGRPPSR